MGSWDSPCCSPVPFCCTVPCGDGMNLPVGTLVHAFEWGGSGQLAIGIVLEVAVNRNVSAGYVMYSHMHRVLFADGIVRWKDEHQLLEVE